MAAGALAACSLDSRDERRPYPGATRPTFARCLPAWLMSFLRCQGFGGLCLSVSVSQRLCPRRVFLLVRRNWAVCG